MNIRTIRIEDQGRARYAHDTLDTALGPHEILVETECSFISAGTELAIYTATDPGVRVPGAWCSYPWLAGYANVGRVLAVGAQAQRINVGERVFSFGPHASAFRYDTRKLVVALPDGLEAGEAAALRMAHVALTALDVAEPAYHRWVAVLGLGMVGNLAAQLFALRGAQVIGIDPSSPRRTLAQQCGIAHTLPAAEPEAIRQLTAGRLADTTVDAVGHAAVIMEAAAATADFGEVILLGSPRSSVEGDVNELVRHVHYRWVSLKGALEWRVPSYPQLANEHSQLRKHQALMSWLEQGRLQLRPLLSHRLPPERINEAYQGLLHDKDHYLGVILEWSKA